MAESTTTLWRKLSTPSPRAVLILIVFIQFIVGTVTSFQKPLFEFREDEAGHLNMARFIVNEHRLPSESDLRWDPETLQYSQPPIYYLLNAPLVAMIDDSSPIPGQPMPLAMCEGLNPHLTSWARPRDFNIVDSGAVRTGYALRFTQVLIAVATSITIYAATLRLSSGIHQYALTAAALFAFMPSLVSTVAYIGNDVLVMFWGALGIYIYSYIHQSTNLKRLGGSIFFLILVSLFAILTKTTGWSILVLPLLALWEMMRISRITRRLSIIFFSLIVLLAIGVGYFNYQTYGSVIGRYPLEALQAYQNLNAVLQPVGMELTASINQAGQLSSSAVRGLERIHNISLLILATSFITLPYTLVVSPRLRRLLFSTGFLIAASLTLLLIRNLSVIHDLYIFAPFRYLGPAIPAIAIMSAVALCQLPKIIGKTVPLLIVATWITVSLLATLYSEASVIQRYSIVPGNTLPEYAVALTTDQADLPLSVEGYSLEANDTFNDGRVALTLYLKGHQSEQSSLALLDIHVGATSCRFVPVGGFRPNTSIGDGEIIAANIELPYCDSATDNPIPITLSWRSVSADGRSTTVINSPLVITTIQGKTANPSNACLPNFGTIDNAFRVIKVDIPSNVINTDVIQPSVSWLTLEATTKSYIRVYALTNSEGNEIARCQETPRRGTYPTTQWREGEIVYNDSCSLALPRQLSAGDYQLWAGMIDPESNEYLPHDGQTDRHLLYLGTFQISEN
jgi:hypothetical protein